MISLEKVLIWVRVRSTLLRCKEKAAIMTQAWASPEARPSDVARVTTQQLARPKHIAGQAGNAAMGLRARPELAPASSAAECCAQAKCLGPSLTSVLVR